ncbi:hypothetical protein FIV00_14965 [Labrenzia sp. THAF82]|uniref:helix-turn-helix domain-containing protein n=1 Tax=Labrenzia sp. THAF82 TaxID=2587861 RepID=UPI0012684421|nr:helix-turn-helix transcriptional regulator [Labrenzia sp. THAF82]QFT31791.1 hypothetical protein FIV00_14965 [Labrenzia sp. THAF82]
MMRLDREKLGEALLREREKRGLNMRAVHALTGISIATISRAERAHPDIYASAETVLILCKLYRLDPLRFVQDVSREYTHETSRMEALADG